jgi:hypothetical protein
VRSEPRSHALLVHERARHEAISHGSRTGDEIAVEFAVQPRRVRICVRDPIRRGSSALVALSPDERRSAGRGLQIVEQFADWSERVVDGISLPLSVYETVRADAQQFVVLPLHYTPLLQLAPGFMTLAESRRAPRATTAGSARRCGSVSSHARSKRPLPTGALKTFRPDCGSSVAVSSR